MWCEGEGVRGCEGECEECEGEGVRERVEGERRICGNWEMV